MAINPFFNAEYYLATNLDLIRAGFTASNDEGKAALWNHYTTYGAQEALQVANRDALREPNPWFNVDYYLQANPDLGAAGIGAADALNHYYQYGVFENREFSATVRVADFDAQSYADDNPDLREAFGIEDNTPVTAEQADLLLQHYLAYGYLENRDGAGDIANVIGADNIIEVDWVRSETGTIMNDLFKVSVDLSTAAPTPVSVLDGLGGVDTVRFEVAQDTTTTPNAVNLRNIEKVVVDTANATDDVTFNSSQLVDITVEQAANDIVANFSGVNGTNDAINILTEANVASITTTGVETINLELDGGAPAELHLNNAQGENLAVNISGAGAGAWITVGSVGSVDVKTVTIDASATTGALNLTADSSLVHVQNIVMKGGAGANTFTNGNNLAVTVTVSENFTATGGAGVDTFNGSLAIDTFTGGAGNDVFDFSATNAAVVRLSSDKKTIEAVDTITDFKAGDSVTGVAITAVNVAVSTGISFETAVTVLADGNVFQWGNDAYVLVTKGVLGTDNAFTTDPELIKLAGVNAADLVFDLINNELVYA